MQKATTLVIKIGSAVLMRDGLRSDREAFCRLIGEIAALHEEGNRIVVVSSGAVATGRRKMRLTHRPTGDRSIPKLQALAALGQSRLLQLYENEFAHYDIHIAQLLLTRDDFNNRQRYINARNALQAIHDFGAIPIINENDTVATDEIKFGDNDQLAAMVATMVSADRLMLLSDIQGLYTSNPKLDPDATFLHEVRANDPAIDAMIGDIQDAAGFGTGGMRTKILAARMAARTGIETIIAPGKSAGVLQSALDRNAGTLLSPDPETDKLAARKAWIALTTSVKGSLICDEGAVRALTQEGRSLLPKGIVSVLGDFQEGDAVELVDTEGKMFARGLSLYSSEAILRIQGKHSSEIQDALGYKMHDAVIHRDDLTLEEA